MKVVLCTHNPNTTITTYWFLIVYLISMYASFDPQWYECACKLVRKHVDVIEHEKLSNMSLETNSSKGDTQHFIAFPAFYSHDMFFNNEHNSCSKMSVKLSLACSQAMLFISDNKRYISASLSFRCYLVYMISYFRCGESSIKQNIIVQITSSLCPRSHEKFTNTDKNTNHRLPIW